VSKKEFIAISDNEEFPLCGVSFWDDDRKEHLKEGRKPSDYKHHYRAVSRDLIERHDALYAEFMEVDARLRKAFRSAKKRPTA
jgi:hypothetical protein